MINAIKVGLVAPLSDRDTFFEGGIINDQKLLRNNGIFRNFWGEFLKNYGGTTIPKRLLIRPLRYNQKNDFIKNECCFKKSEKASYIRSNAKYYDIIKIKENDSYWANHKLLYRYKKQVR